MIQKLGFAIRRSVVCALILVGCCRMATCQTPQAPKVFAPAPNAAALGKYGDIPVSTYTGTANVSVPLYNIQYKDVNIPIGLDYHTGGIRVQERAGWTGLGWVLNSVGVINREVRDKDDFVSTPGILLEDRADMSPFYCMSFGNSNFTKSMFTTGVSPRAFNFVDILPDLYSYDREIDLFTYNILGRSGKFTVHSEDNEIIFDKVEDLKIIPALGNDQAFTVVDETGTRYFFDKRETAKESNSTNTFTQSWYLTEIAYPSGAKVTFEYLPTTNPDQIYFAGSEYYGCVAQSPGIVQGWINYQDTYYLKKISFDGGYVEFLEDSNRLDYSGIRITGLRVYSLSTFTAAPVLVKEMEFQYSHFGGDNINKRLRLDGVFEKKGVEKLPGYRFTYNQNYAEGAIDLNHPSQDHWGYFNNAPGESRLAKFSGGPVSIMYATPDWVSNTATYPILNLPGMDRTPSEENMKVFSLAEVQYPTGGKTVITTEINRYNDLLTVKADPYTQYVQDSRVFFIESRGDTYGVADFLDQPNDNPVTVTIQFQCSADEQKGCPGTITPDGRIYVDIGNERRDMLGPNCDCLPSNENVRPCQASYTIPAGQTNVSYRVHIDPTLTTTQFKGVRLNFEFLRERTVQNSTSTFTEAPGGGLRVKNISDYDASGAFVKGKKYEYFQWQYINGQNVKVSTGRLLRPITYFKYTLTSVYSGDYCRSLERMARTLFPLSSSVAYDKVIEYEINSSFNQTNGRIEYEYHNVPDSLYNYDFTGCHTKNLYGPTIANFETSVNPVLSSGASMVANPNNSVGVNSSTKVAYFSQPAETGNGFSILLPGDEHIDQYDYMYFKVRSSAAGNVRVTFKLNGVTKLTATTASVPANEWVETKVNIAGITYDYFDEVGFYFQPNNIQSVDLYIDDVYLLNSTGLDAPWGSMLSAPEPISGNMRPPGLPILSHKLNGSLLRKTVYGSGKISETVNTYSTTLVKRYFSYQTELVPTTNRQPELFLFYVYPTSKSEHVFLKSTVQYDYYSGLNGGNYDRTDIQYTYGQNHEQPIQVKTTNSKGQYEVQKSIYPQDLGTLSSTLYGYKNLQDNNVHKPIEQYSLIDDKVVAGSLTTFKENLLLPDKVLSLDLVSPIADFAPVNHAINGIDPDDRYTEKLLFKEYDDKKNLQLFAKGLDASSTYLWGYRNKIFPIAEIRNASVSSTVAFSSFEAEKSEGNWTFTGTPVSPGGKTGDAYYNLTTGNITKSVTAGTYRLEYYAKGAVTITLVGATITDLGAGVADAGGWILYRKKLVVPSSAMLTLSGSSIHIDELRLYPANAQMTTYTYYPLIGYHTVTEPNMMSTFYEYDSFNRLKFIRDHKRNIVKSIEYVLGNQQ
jgi:hypothetical protein